MTTFFATGITSKAPICPGCACAMTVTTSPAFSRRPAPSLTTLPNTGPRRASVCGGIGMPTSSVRIRSSHALTSSMSRSFHAVRRTVMAAPMGFVGTPPS